MKDTDFYRKQIIPLPPDSALMNKPVIGIMPCVCGDARTVRPDKKGRPTAWCDTLATVHKCGRHISLDRSDMPEQTFENFESHDLSILPVAYQEALIEAWKSEGFENTENLEKFEENQDILEVQDNDIQESEVGKSETPGRKKAAGFLKF